MKYNIIILALLIWGCQKEAPVAPYAPPVQKQKTDTVYYSNWSWDNIVGNQSWASNYAYEGNPTSYTGNDIIEDLVSVWIRPAYSTQSWVKVPCKGYFTPNDSIVFYPLYGLFYKYGTNKVTPQNIDVKAFAYISN